MPETNQIKFGRIALVGRPNTGKSTLINNIMNQKVSITSPLPQTTRRNIRVVYKDNRGVLVISDTPGIIQKVVDLVSKQVNIEAPKELVRADVVVMVVDISRPKSEEENKVIGLIRKTDAKKVLVYNKIDQAVGRADHLAEYNYLEEEFDKTIAVSAIKGKNVKGLVNILFDLVGTEAENKVADIIGKDNFAISMNSEEYIEEIIREKAYLFLRKEVPYSINIEVKKIEEKDGIIVIEANILTTADRYKKMIIGKGGRMIKLIGSTSRKELELMSGKKVYLELEVAVDRHWPERTVE